MSEGFLNLASRRFLQVSLAALFLLTASAPLLSQDATSAPSVISPDHRLQLQFAINRDAKFTDNSGSLVYSLTYNGKPIIENSALSLKLVNQPPLGADVHIAQVTPSSGVDDYDLIAGKASHVHDAYNSVLLTVAEPNGGRTMAVEARAYNGAVAFRYIVPQQASLRGFRLEDEHTEFNFDKDASTWALELPNFRSGYESEYVHLNISAFAQQGGTPSHFLIGLPLLAHVPGVAWVAITEADLEGNGVMYLKNSSVAASTVKAGFRLETVRAPRFNDPPSYPTQAATGILPHHSAWRVFQVGDQPGDLIESNIIDDLNPPSAIADTSWIHAGKTAWAWWNGNTGPDGKSANTTATMEYYVDFASQSKFRYMLIDGGWSEPDDITKMNGNVDVPAVVKYAAGKGVKVWVWTHYNPTAEQMGTAFPLYEKWGVAGVKIDFVQRGDQPGIEFYYKAAKLAAEHHLMLDFHGGTTPWGISRTYPNVLGYEAVMGMEYSKWSARDNPIHRTTIPFTRMLNGTMDYTPGGFGNATEAGFIPRSRRPMVQGTRAQQLALYVVYFDPFQMVADAPSAYENQPAFQFIRDVPATWDETRVLQGFPSETITVARRSGKDWYLGSITNWTPRDISLPLGFLGSGQYIAEIYQDAKDADQNPQHVSIERKTVQQGETLTLHLQPGGGCAIRFVPKA
ncbi:MAG: glycoside hydrolase family 97 protein [Edaphobacter sp.]